MGEIPEPRIEIHIHFDDAEKLIESVKALGRRATEPVAVAIYDRDEQLGLFEVDYRRDSGREVLTNRTFQNYYFEQYNPTDASSLPRRIFMKIARLVGEEGVERDKKGEVVAIKRGAFDSFVEMLQQPSIEKIEGFGPKSQSKAFVIELSKTLPSPEENQV